jgi:DNA-binding MarR family transcriptional regulator
MPSQDDQIVLALRRITQAIDTWSRKLWHEHGLTAPQLATLREILAGQNVSPGTLAVALHISQPVVTGILGRLESRGLILRQRSSTDRRSTIAVATEEGRQLAAKAPQLLRDRFRLELATLPIWQQTQILAVLQHVAEMMHAPQISPAPFFQDAAPKKRGSAKRPASTERDADKPSHPVPR